MVGQGGSSRLEVLDGGIVEAAQVEVGLFAFNQLKRVNVQLALPKGQAKRELKRPNGKLSLAP